MNADTYLHADHPEYNGPDPELNFEPYFDPKLRKSDEFFQEDFFLLLNSMDAMISLYLPRLKKVLKPTTKKIREIHIQRAQISEFGLELEDYYKYVEEIAKDLKRLEDHIVELVPKELRHS